MTKFKMDINTPFIKELIILVMGPLFQVFAYYLLINIFKDIDLIKMYHLGILSFNLLPIYPLDGGRIINLFINKKYPFYKSLEISIIISYLIIVLILFTNIKIGINIIIMELFLVLLIHKEEKKKDIYFQKFILERYFNKYNYKKSIMINSIRKLYKYKTNYIKIGKILYTEKEFIALNYQIFNKKC
ncbi:MAG: hypothetical protein IKQ06_05855 [Bacilli bacterium]|nr:hypothetical protein [Bacilli bacterium]